MILTGDKQKDDMAKALALKRSQWRADLTALMENAAGKRVIGYFVSEARKRPFTNDDRTTSYNLGRSEFLRDFIDQLKDVSLPLFQAIERDTSEKLP